MPQTLQSGTLSDSQAEALRQAAAEAARNAYAPYSRFYVGAAVLLSSGETVTGCNVENVSYRLTTCAEQTAIARAVAEHGPGIEVVAVAVANADAGVACQPCGACRQTIAEFAEGSCRIIYPGDNGKPDECTLADLLPAEFAIKTIA
ncbi:cytidine deaminase [Terriglobus aquaticus]|uniref:Cytidine deaminase n=1 Tax=Terriglobus aquaticus TaxID=940139 RepID=A0ABW9KNA9_9BACT|nr:cytidine deaminase [Terriglobus aquaticus]